VNAATQPPSRDEHPLPIRDRRPALRCTLLLDVVLRLAIWGAALALTLTIFHALGAWPDANPFEANFSAAVRWAVAACWFILLFNVLYVAVLILIRLPIPTPREGRYPKPGGPPDIQLLWMTLLVALNKARYFPPFPGVLVFQIANLPPMCWLMGPIFGPRSKSCYPLDPAILDPALVEIGRNVVIGFNSVIAGHYQQPDAWILKKTVIEDDAVIGGNVIIYSGVRVGRGAIIASGAIVLPDTVIGPGEFWGGLPAKKISDLPRAE
jgi:hypothetical protein